MRELQRFYGWSAQNLSRHVRSGNLILVNPLPFVITIPQSPVRIEQEMNRRAFVEFSTCENASKRDSCERAGIPNRKIRWDFHSCLSVDGFPRRT
jgi:hypothetical protein